MICVDSLSENCSPLIVKMIAQDDYWSDCGDCLNDYVAKFERKPVQNMIYMDMGMFVDLCTFMLINLCTGK